MLELNTPGEFNTEDSVIEFSHFDYRRNDEVFSINLSSSDYRQPPKLILNNLGFSKAVGSKAVGKKGDRKSKLSYLFPKENDGKSPADTAGKAGKAARENGVKSCIENVEFALDSFSVDNSAFNFDNHTVESLYKDLNYNSVSNAPGSGMINSFCNPVDGSVDSVQAAESFHFDLRSEEAEAEDDEEDDEENNELLYNQLGAQTLMGLDYKHTLQFDHNIHSSLYAGENDNSSPKDIPLVKSDIHSDFAYDPVSTHSSTDEYPYSLAGSESSLGYMSNTQSYQHKKNVEVDIPLSDELNCHFSLHNPQTLSRKRYSSGTFPTMEQKPAMSKRSKTLAMTNGYFASPTFQSYQLSSFPTESSAQPFIKQESSFLDLNSIISQESPYIGLNSIINQEIPTKKTKKPSRYPPFQETVIDLSSSFQYSSKPVSNIAKFSTMCSDFKTSSKNSKTILSEGVSITRLSGNSNGAIMTKAKLCNIGGKKNTNPTTFVCNHCSASFKVKGYLSRHLKKHSALKAFICPFFKSDQPAPQDVTKVDILDDAKHEKSKLNLAGAKCHPSGGFSRRDTYKTHLKALHFIYPLGTKSTERNDVGGRCAGCLEYFHNNNIWLEDHIEKGNCSFFHSTSIANEAVKVEELELDLSVSSV